ncbi:MAG: hypothetical protein WCP30_02775 [Mycobacteriaceae bacterium]
MRRFTLGFAATAAAAALLVPTAVASPESDASDAINQSWQAAGGSDSPVGSKDGDVFGVGDGFGQKFSDGKIFYTPTTGAHLIFGAILDKYESLGGPADSDLGFPNIDEVAGLVSSKSQVSTFSASDKPAIFWTADTGAWAVRGAINAAWDKLGGSAGALGVPTEDERYDGDVVSQKFTGGSVSWNRVSNTFTTDPPALAEKLAGLEVPSDPTTLISLAWRTTGGLGGPLGARQGEQTTVGDGGAAQGYAGGKIFFSPQTGAHAVTGAILSKYESVGGPTGDLGYPVGTEVDGGVPNSRVSSFSAADKPVIFWTPDSGAIVVRGAINAAWAKLGGATGSLGVPTSEETVKGDTVTQTFSGGDLSWNNATKEFSSKPADLAAGLSGLEMPDSVAQTPAAPSSGSSDEGGGRHWWWLAILLPVLALLGLLAVLAQRRAGTRRQVVEGGRAVESDDDFWPGTRIRHDEPRSEPGAGRDYGMWSPPAVDEAIGESDFESDEDAIDTAPTRIPEVESTDVHEFRSQAAEFDTDDWLGASSSGGGRHSATAAVSPAMWRLDLDEVPPSRHRHAADEPVADEYVAEVVEDFRVESGFDQAPEGPADEPWRPADEPWRPAIHLPLADPFQSPEGYVIKGNTHSGLYYTPDSVLYENTIPEVWFASEELAEGNGFVKAPE